MTRQDKRPRQRLSEQTRRAAILHAAGEAFSRSPYEQVSVDAIAAAAGASQALVHRYFRGKSGLYVAVVESAVAELLQRQHAADAALGPESAPRERVTASLWVYLDVVKEWAVGWRGPFLAPGGEPDEAGGVRRRSRLAYVALLREVLELDPRPDLDYALHGYLGFVDRACLAWAEAGYPDDHRPFIVDQALGALYGAVGSSNRRIEGNPSFD
jgi:AcrR family transcriptional regulator